MHQELTTGQANHTTETTSDIVDYFTFYPHLDWQKELMKDVLYNWNYYEGTHTALCSGTVGSGKSLVGAHLAVDHVINYDNARCLIGRRALPDLKDTLYQEIVEHLTNEYMIEGKHYFLNETRAKIRFANGSEIIGRSWADKNYKKLGSLKLSAAVVEEGAENDDKDEQAFDFIHMRIGRLPHIPIRWFIILTNPDSPSHFLYEKYINKKSDLHKVYYSFLKDNKFLDSNYEKGMANNMCPKLALRMLEGKWVDITGEVLYQQYDEEYNYKDYSYQVQTGSPVRISWDFNIGEGKPMSVSVSQIINDRVHIFNQVVIEGMRTEDSCEQLALKGLLDYSNHYIIHGDCNGRNNDTRNKSSDYEIIKQYFSNYKNKHGRHISFEIKVPPKNPPIRTRHNHVNAYCCNALGQRRLFVYKDAPMANKGLKLTKLKDKGLYIEDDSKDYQHITTNIGYMLCYYRTDINRRAPSTLPR